MTHNIDSAAVRQLVLEFYDAVRQDPLLQPIFVGAIGDNWQPHLERMVSFWSTVMLGTHEFQGNVFDKHMVLTGITPQHFHRWLALFEQTADRLLADETATEIKLVAHRIAASLQLGF